MAYMSKIDYFNVDGNALRTFLTVLETVSVTKTADILGVSQSAVSHTLDKLRATFDDPLFIRDGRGIRPTAKAQSLHDPVEAILSGLKSLSDERNFDPLIEPIEFTIATNDFPLGFIFPTLLKEMYAEGVKPVIHFVPAGIPSANPLRTSGCQMLITPAPPDKKDIIDVPLVQSKMVCFYDPKVRKPPRTWKQYIDSRYVEVRFSSTESSQLVLPSAITSTLNEPAVSVPNFNALPAFIEGTDLITTQLELMSRGPLKNLDWVPLAIKVEPLNLHLVWHRRDNDDPAHQWLRQRIIETVNSIVAE
jgi:DNA-binding transcriptional LysR family regulator